MYVCMCMYVCMFVCWMCTCVLASYICNFDSCCCIALVHQPAAFVFVSVSVSLCARLLESVRLRACVCVCVRVCIYA